MKRLATLFMFLIGMISYTSMASTPLMEQKQKPTFEQSVMQTQDVVKVELEFAVFSYDAVFFVNENLQNENVLLKKLSFETAITAVNQYMLNGTNSQKAIIKCLTKTKIRLADGYAYSVHACVSVDGANVSVYGTYSLDGNPMLEPVASFVDSCKC